MDTLQELNKLMPQDIKFKQSDLPLTKPIIKAKLTRFAKKYPSLYAKNIHQIGNLGEELAYLSGHNMGLADLRLGNQKSIDKKLDGEELKMRGMSTLQKKKHLLNAFNLAQTEVMKNTDNNLVSQAISKARGNPASVTRTAGAVVYAVDMNSEPYPFMIKNSLAKGLRAHEQYASGGQARFAAVQSAVSTSEPGAMGKVLIANTEHLKIAEKDCGTRNGIPLSLDGTDAIDRYEAGTNKLITPQYLSQLKKRGKKSIIARSPRTCQSTKGICSMCFGLNEKGHLHSSGHNIGIEASESVSEKAVQLVLNAKHNVSGKAGGSRIPTGYQAVKTVLNSTETFPGKATVSTLNGRVDKITPLATGGHNIEISGQNHFVSHDVSPKVKIGTQVDMGDILSTGIASTKDMMQYRGVQEARAYLSHQLDKAHNGSIDNRNFEVISRGYLDLVKPRGMPGTTNLHSYDTYVPSLSGTHELVMKTSDKQLVKKHLAEPILNYSPGKPITKAVQNNLIDRGIKSVLVSHTAMPYTPVFKTYEQKPLFNSSPWQSINYRGIKKGIKDDLLMGEKEDVSKLKSDRAKFTLGIL